MTSSPTAAVPNAESKPRAGAPREDVARSLDARLGEIVSGHETDDRYVVGETIGRQWIVWDTANCWDDVYWGRGANAERNARQTARDLNARERRDHDLWLEDPVAYEESLGDRPLQEGQRNE